MVLLLTSLDSLENTTSNTVLVDEPTNQEQKQAEVNNIILDQQETL